jgi:predicted TIM-barrel fold metal-dependent hydrolase
LLHRPPSASTVWNAQRLISFLHLSGILERYPDLRVILGGSGAGWVADWLSYLNQSNGSEDGASFDPLEYLRGGRIMAAVTATEDAEALDRAVSVAGTKWLVWGSEFPFGSEIPDRAPALRNLSPDAVRRAVAENAEGAIAAGTRASDGDRATVGGALR